MRVRLIVSKVRKNVQAKGEAACDEGVLACVEGERFGEIR